MTTSDHVRVRVRLSGRVQGVGFRYATADEATRRGLAGWVRNLDSGDVEAVFEGPAPAVQDMLRWCREGPPGSFVREVQADWKEPCEGLAEFRIRRTAPR
jgi:acylphosphatase